MVFPSTSLSAAGCHPLLVEKTDAPEPTTLNKLNQKREGQNLLSLHHVYSLFSLLFVSLLLDTLDLLSSFFSDFPSFSDLPSRDFPSEDDLSPEDEFSLDGDLLSVE